MSAPTETSEGPLAIVCAGGSLPFAVADTVLRQGRGITLFAFNGIADATRVAAYPHRWIALGQIGRLMTLIREHGCRDVVFIGSLVRPPLHKIRFDLKTLMVLPRLIAGFRGGDDHLISGIGHFFEENGFRMRGAHEVAPEILVPEGALTARQPSERDRADVARALDVLAAISPFDVGQAAVVANNQVLAIEGVEGTDGMLRRIVDMRTNGRIATSAGTGVLVKAAKAGQDRRFDLPAIGPKTVEGVARAGLAGIAVRAGETLAAELEQMVSAANRENIFVYGIGAAP
jgi:DUF1009 family protein